MECTNEPNQRHVDRGQVVVNLDLPKDNQKKMK